MEHKKELNSVTGPVNTTPLPVVIYHTRTSSLTWCHHGGELASKRFQGVNQYTEIEKISNFPSYVSIGKLETGVHYCGGTRAHQT